MSDLSKKMEEYFSIIQQKVDHCYEIAEEARQKGLDPEIFVESPQAKDLAGRVEKLVGPEGIAEVIRNLKNDGKSDDEIVFQVVSDILEKKLGNMGTLDERVERAIRAGLAIKTMGVVSAPLEGISKILIRKDNYGKSYLSLFFAGPIRAAGGTTAALCVLIADYVREKSNIPKYEATEAEIGRYVEEVKLYDRRVHLQYPSSNDEIRYAVEHLPIEINGDSTEDEEVSAFRDLPRVDTNKIRGGACLVLNDGILLKAPKLMKIATSMNLKGWEWLKSLKNISQKTEKSDEEDIINQKKIHPNSKYVSDIIAGRPVFSHPSRIGGHRIRYGRSRNTGLAAAGMHPATMTLLDNFIAIGTQLRIERPGKSASICPVNSIEPPIVKLKDGSVIKVKTKEKAKRIFPEVESILFLGDILFGFGEFAENNHKLIPSGYVEEWWALELENALQKLGETPPKLKTFIQDPFYNVPSAEDAIKLAYSLKIPLHPFYTDYWGNVSVTELEVLRIAMNDGFDGSEKKIYLKNDPKIKEILEKAFVVHLVKDGVIEFSNAKNYIFQSLFDLLNSNHISLEGISDSFSYFKLRSGLEIRNKAPYYMGTRMGRPEKSERKSMKGVHSLFPLSDKVGNQRLVEKAIELGTIKIDVGRKKCPNCHNVSLFNKCPLCGSHTEVQKICVKCKKTYSKNTDKCSQCGQTLNFSNEASFNFKNYINSALASLGLTLPKKFKAIFGLTNQFKLPEPIEKGILRAKNGLLVYKTAEIRYDATDIPLTHFKPKEIGTSIKKLKELGYEYDYQGKPLEETDQIIELKVQDVLLSEDCASYFLRLAKFLDDELESFYQLKRFYNVSDIDDLIGHLVVGLAPHTSAGIIGRIIGTSPARSIYAHPYWHAAKRRNCFPGNSTVLVKINEIIKRITLKDLYDLYFQQESFKDNVYVKNQTLEDIKVFSYDDISGKVLPTKIVDVIKSPIKERLIKFKLYNGRSFETTPNHPVLIYANDKLIEKKANLVSEDDEFLIPSIDFELKDIDEFDLIKEFSNPVFKDLWDDLMIRGIREYIKNLIMIKGLKTTAEILGINKKTLNSYYSPRNSIPFSILLKLLNLNKLTIQNLPECTLGFKRDHTTVPRIIKVNDSLMKIFGYYISEGYYREIPTGYQVDLAVSEKDLQEDMIFSIKDVFGNDFNPYIDDNRITISNRVIYLFFKGIIKFHNSARTKRIPEIFFNFPLKKLSFLISAYFSGDGGLDISHKTVTCSSFSKELIYDLDLILLRFGIFSAITQFEREGNTEYKLRIRGDNVFRFKEMIGFTSERKTKLLFDIIESKKTISERRYRNHRLLKIREIEIKNTQERYVYSLNAEKFHTILINENIVTHQCDGDEDGIMLLLDPLLNFSRFYLPNKIGGRMDATLVISTKLDPNEIDGEAHNIDTLYRYPLEFYEATQNFASPQKIEDIMNLVKTRLGTEKQYEDLGFNIPTDDINEGPLMTAYKTHENMEEKIEAQLHIAKIIKAVDAKKVAEKILSTHFNPDILGNLRKFSVQEFRCVKCNEKFRRPPMSNNGKCPKCGKKVILTVNSGGIEKYIPRAQKLCKEFNLDHYTVQRMELIEEYVESLTNNPKIKQQKLSDFF